MNKKFLNLCLENKKAQKYNAEFIAEQNLNKALENDEFEKINKKEKECIIQMAKDSNISNEKEYQNVLKEKNVILKKLGFTENDLQPKYSCPVCQDKGIVDGNYCQCLQAHMSILLAKQSGFLNLHSFCDADFSLFEEKNKNSFKNMYEKMQLWCNKVDSDKKTIILSGPSGTGKTFLMECMANELINNKQYVYFSTAFNFVNQMLKYHTTFDESKSSLIEPFLDCDVLFIDDLGTEPIFKNVTLEYLYFVINERILNNKKLVISTNLDIQKLIDRYQERITSRLTNKQSSLLLKLENKDLRI